MPGETARSYHEATNHLEAFPPRPRRVDPALVPRPYKLYRDLSPRPLPPSLDSLLKYSNGIVRRRTVNGVERTYRAASCTGGAYHIEAYVADTTGLYHYGAQDHALRQLRAGDHRRTLANAAALDETPETFVVLTSVFYGNAWRYEDRAYRHVFWDAGTVLANLEALAAARHLPLRACIAFVDAAVDRLLGLDPQKELTVCVIALGPPLDAPPSPGAPPLDHALVPASRVEIEYPRIVQAHAAGAVTTPGEVTAWRATHAAKVPQYYTPPTYGNEPIESIIARRTSARRFNPGPLTPDELQSLLDAATAPLPFDVATPVTTTQVLPPGANAMHLALDQPIAGQAATNLYVTANLGAVLETYGDRGYRLAQLEGGLRGGRVYLAATALNLRATGLTFYDDAVKRALGSDPMFLIAVGD